MKGMLKIFDKSPACQDVYLIEGTWVLFPIKFCETRWIEEGEVAEWTLETWDSRVATVRFWVGLFKFKQPRNNKSSDTLVTHHQDLLIPAKSNFFAFIAGMLKSFLVLFQNDQFMLSFMHHEQSKVLTWLLGLVFRKKKLDEAKKITKIKKRLAQQSR